MIERELGVIRTGILDAINAQHPILDENADRPPNGTEFAQHVRGRRGCVGLIAVLDLDRLAHDLLASINSVAARDAAPAEQQILDAAAELEADRQARLDAEFDALDETTAEPTHGEPWRHPEGATALCRHCGVSITPAPGSGNGWRHTASKLLSCAPGDAKTEWAAP